MHFRTVGEGSHRLADEGLRGAGRGYRSTMTIHPNQAASDEADPEKQSSPAGVVEDLEEEAKEAGASTDPPKD